MHSTPQGPITKVYNDLVACAGGTTRGRGQRKTAKVLETRKVLEMFAENVLGTGAASTCGELGRAAG
eukprot:3529187-Pyramimonas_sp.AAC.1